MESEQLSDGHDPGPGGRGGNPGTHPVQGDLLPNLGGSLLVSVKQNIHCQPEIQYLFVIL